MATAVQEQPKSDNALRYLSIVIKIQAVLFLLYGLGWFLMPNTILESVFNFKVLPEAIHPRAFGAVFIGVAYLEYLVDRHLSERLDLIWGFVLIPALLFVALIIEYNNLGDVQFFLWSSLAITGIFTIIVAFLRWQANE